jgi:hypothetical protein
MIESLLQHGDTVLIDVFRLRVWLAILTIVFVPLERLFALDPRPIRRMTCVKPGAASRPITVRGREASPPPS